MATHGVWDRGDVNGGPLTHSLAGFFQDRYREAADNSWVHVDVLMLRRAFRYYSRDDVIHVLLHSVHRRERRFQVYWQEDHFNAGYYLVWARLLPSRLPDGRRGRDGCRQHECCF